MKLVASTPNSEPLPEAILGVLDAISPDDLREIVERLSVPRVYRTPENEAVGRMIRGLFLVSEVAGLGVATDEEGNIIVGDPRRARTLIGAHYDAVAGTPGADDNASALAVLLTTAGAVGPLDELCFVAFNGEEEDRAGSRAFVRRLDRNRLEQVHILEMVGFRSRKPDSQGNPVPPLAIPTVGNFLGLVGTHHSRHVLDHVLHSAGHSTIPVYGLYLPDVPLESISKMAPHVFRSDHAPFWEAGVPALMWTDTAEFRNPHYHLPSDTPETLDYDFMAEVARLLVLVVLSGIQGKGR